VTDRASVSWERCITDHAALVGVDVPHVAAEKLVPPARERVLRGDLRALPEAIADSAFWRPLTRIPIVKRGFHSLPEPTKQAVRRWLRGSEPVQRSGSQEHQFRADHPFIAGQKRTVAHSSDKARRLLGYTAPVSYDEGMRLTEAWARQAQILDATPPLPIRGSSTPAAARA
jgi:hypothetical protein